MTTIIQKGLTYEIVEEKTFLKGLFRKKEEIDYPDEFGIITFTEEAVLYGIFEDFTTEIRHYRGNKYISKPYHKGVIESLEEDGVPVYDARDKQFELPIFQKTNPAEVEHETIK